VGFGAGTKCKEDDKSFGLMTMSGWEIFSLDAGYIEMLQKFPAQKPTPSL
jgi:hypothetical protein